jgi:hypothetical protein
MAAHLGELGAVHAFEDDHVRFLRLNAQIMVNGLVRVRILLLFFVSIEKVISRFSDNQ